MKIIVRYILMLLFSAIAGALSGWLIGYVMMARGAILAVCLSLGIIYVNSMLSKDSANHNHRKTISVIGLLCGLIAGTIMTSLKSIFHINYDGNYNMGFNDFAIRVICCIYGVMLITAYTMHFQYNIDTYTNTSKHIIKAALICVITRLLFSIHMFFSINGSSNELGIPLEIIIWILIISFGTLPFCFAWFIVMAVSDPYWHSSYTQLYARNASTTEVDNAAEK